MQTFAFSFALILTGACALPSNDPVIKVQSENERLIDGIVLDLVQSAIDRIVELRLDPVNIGSWSGRYQLPVTNLFEAEAAVEDVHSRGLSNIVVDEVTYNILSSRLVVELSLPSVQSSVGNAEGRARLMEFTLSGAVSGSLALSDLRIRADITAGFGIISGVSVRSVHIDFSLGGIKSDLSVNIQGNDYSDAINNFLGATLPNALETNADEINELLEYIVWRVLENMSIHF